MKLKVLLTLSIIILGSQFTHSQPRTNDLPVIDISKNYPKKEFILQDIADIEYVRLETSDDVLLSGISHDDVSVLSYLSDKYILVSDNRRGEIFVFNRRGEIITHFNHKGGSGREYPYIAA